MRKTAGVIIAVFIVFCFGLPTAFSRGMEISDKKPRVVVLADSLTIFDCYRLALKQSETVAKQGELIKEAEAHFTQALSVITPSVSFVATQGRQDQSVPGSPKSSYERKFVFKQNLFTGFKEIAGITGSKVERTQFLKAKERAEQLLFTDVSDAFYLFLEQQNDLVILSRIRGVLQSRIKELKAREALGRSRRSERASAQVQLYSIDSEIQLTRSRLEVARELLEFLTGVAVSSVSDTPGEFPLLGSKEYYIPKAQLRADVESAEAAVEVAKKKMIIARSGFFPTLSLQADYYVSRNTVPSNSDWDGMLEADVPIFDWVQTAGDVKEARARVIEAELDLQLVKRQSVTDIRQAYDNLSGSIAQTKALGRALTAASLNYRLQEEDYRRNLVNNLDVLDAIRTFSETKRSYSRARYEAKRLYWQFCIATGELILNK
jgi:outer membrane protein